MGYEEYLDNVKRMIDDLKAMTADLGLANTGDEYKIISELFTYKFLNDKLINDFDNRDDKTESFEDFVDYADSKTARIKEQYLLKNLFQKQNEKDFHKTLDKAMVDISEMNKDVYSIETSTGLKKPLFEALSVYLRDPDKENELAVRAINILNKYKFENIFDKGWDYFSTIFEYLIKDYNKDSGKYAEYFTPVSAGTIMAEILYNNTPVDKVSLYDPAAGSGTLLLCMANKIGTKNCTIYSQDRSQKSTQFLRINLILNGLAHSLANVVEGNTMTNPSHLEGEKLKQFDFIVSNPPFNVDFSADVSTMESDKYNRFFAGIPNIPKKDKGKMYIYLPFLQHILASLSKNGRAAIVVPTGFITAGSGIQKKIRTKVIDENWVNGVVSMPSNIFATTGTNVSILFLDKTKTSDDVLLIDASNLGEKVSLEDGQRTILSPDDERLIIDTFLQRKVIDDFSARVSVQDIKDNDYQLSAKQYQDVKIVYSSMSQEEFSSNLKTHFDEIKFYYEKSKELESEITKLYKELSYDKI